MRFPVVSTAAGLICLICLGANAQIKRSRAESMPGIIASNTIGFGDIWLASALAYYDRSHGQQRLEPYQAVGFGISQNFSISAGAVPLEGDVKKLIGKSDAHLKITLPGNDNLRLFGLAVQGDVVFSTEQDTVGEGENSRLPSYTPRAGVTVAADMDLVKYVKWLPLKCYLNWSLFDNDRLLVEFDQHSLRGALEYKGPRHSVFAALHYGLYRKIVRQRGEPQGGYDEYYLAVVPGCRIRILNRFSLTGQAFLTIAAKEEPGSAFWYDRMGFRAGLEFPLFYRESNAEAIRTMIFLKTRKGSEEKEAEAAARQREKEAKIEGLLFSSELGGRDKTGLMKALKQDEAMTEREERLREKRKKVEEELKRIEAMLE